MDTANQDRARIILHIDMDAFFAAIEQRDNPDIRGLPVIISGDPNMRSVVSTCSYEAREFGIYSSMPSKTALRLCPQGVFIKPRINYYKEVAEGIFNIYRSWTDWVEPLSLDEAFLDMTCNKYGVGSGIEIAVKLKETIRRETGLTCSAGVSFNKFLAKIASDYQKPNGLTVINEDNYQGILDEMAVSKFFGVGKVTAEKLNRRGIYKGSDLRRMSEKDLCDIMNLRGSVIYRNIRGIDTRPVEPDRERKSVGKESTLKYDVQSKDLLPYFEHEARQLSKQLQRKNIRGYTVTIKIKYSDFTVCTRRMTCSESIQSLNEIMEAVKYLLENNKLEEKPVRLVGVYLSKINAGQISGNKEKTQYEQLSLF